MEITEIAVDGYEKVVRCRDRESGLHALIAIHDTTLGPSLGGMRMWPYASEDEALFDVLRLSKGMTYKSAVAETGLGGGKSVILGDPRTDKSEELFRAMGRFVDSLDGRYITAEDMNIGVADLREAAKSTKHVAGLAIEDGGSGNPSPYTARGVVVGMRAVIEEVSGSTDFSGHSILIQGVGAVGGEMARLLKERGADVIVCDIKEDRVRALCERYGLRSVPEAEHLDEPCDIYAPCARGAGINDETIPRLTCTIVAGCANNMLLEPRHGDELRKRGILYAPDYVINAGGIVNVSVEFHDGGYDEKVALRKIERIPQALKELWTISKEEDVPPCFAADRLAQRILAEGKAGGR